MTTLDLPAVAVTRIMANELMDSVRRESSTTLKLNGRDLDINSSTFLMQLVSRIEEAGFKTIELTVGGPKWYEAVREAAQLKGLTAKVVPF